MTSELATSAQPPTALTPLPLRGWPASASPPRPISPLVGRDREVAYLTALLRTQQGRLVTLTGPGGVGKTRLAVEVAAELGDAFRDGVAFVALTTIDEPSRLSATLARTLGVEDLGVRPASAVLVEALRGRDLLLTLDNLEHLLDAAALLSELLAGCPALRILTTSRVRLRLSGEHVVSVKPLVLPDPERVPPLTELPTFGAIQLWTERAQAADPAFALTTDNAADVAAICRRLDGLPLAIELAAAWSRLLSPAEILARLNRRLGLLTDGPRDQPARLQTMTNAIAWSYDLLTTGQQSLFRRLAVFVGACTIEAAAAVAGPESSIPGGAPASRAARTSELGPGHPIFDGIAALVDHHLLARVDRFDGGREAEHPRFGMLEMVREFGLEQLTASGEEIAARDAHATYLLALAADIEPRLFGPDQLAWLDRLELDLPNVRAALDWLYARGRTEDGLRLATAPGRFWYRRGYLGEGRSWLDAFLALPTAEGAWPLRSLARVWALILAGDLAAWQKDIEQARAWHGEAAALARSLGDARSLAMALYGLGSDAIDRGEPARAEPLLAESVARFREVGDEWGIALARSRQGSMAHARGDYAGAVACNEQALAVFRERQDWRFIAGTLDALGQLALVQGDGRGALRAYTEALALSTALGDKTGVAWSLMGMAGVAGLAGRAEPAVRLLGAAAALRGVLGARLGPDEQAIHDRIETGARTTVEPAAFAALWEEGAALPLADAIAEATAVAGGDAAGAARPAGEGTSSSDVSPRSSPAGLTPREREVLRLLVEGASDHEIAERLFISRKTASNHVAAILETLGVANRTAATALAVRRGLV